MIKHSIRPCSSHLFLSNLDPVLWTQNWQLCRTNCSEPELKADELPEAIEVHTAQLGAFQVSLGA